MIVANAVRSVGCTLATGLVLLPAAVWGCAGSGDETTAAPITGVQQHRDRSPGILLGNNYTHLEFDGCSFEGEPLLATYHREGIRARAQEQLRYMRTRGVETLRLVLWHMRDIEHHEWGVVPSRGGTLTQRHRENLRWLLDDVAAHRFDRLTVSFAPQWRNNPVHTGHDGEHLEENWAFMLDVDAVVRASGIAEVRYDLLNEGAPATSFDVATYDRVAHYISEIWRRSSKALSLDGVTISAIAPGDPAEEADGRIENLVAILRTVDRPLPSWLEVHLYGSAEEVAYGLRAADRALTAADLGVPITVGETVYNDGRVAAAIAGTELSRPLEEVMQWFSRPDDRCNVDPPYDVDVFVDVFGSR